MQVSVRLELAPALPTILGDRVQLQQVIINLVDERHRGDAIGHGPAARARDPLRPGRQRAACWSPSRIAASGSPPRTRTAVQCLLHHQTRRHGHGTVDLPLDRRSSWRDDCRLPDNDGPGATFQFTLPLHQEDAS